MVIDTHLECLAVINTRPQPQFIKQITILGQFDKGLSLRMGSKLQSLKVHFKLTMVVETCNNLN